MQNLGRSPVKQDFFPGLNPGKLKDSLTKTYMDT